MLRFYSIADRHRKFLELYRINSVEDYTNTINNLIINLNLLNNQNTYHPDYIYIEQYLNELIENCKGRIIFLGCFDVSKEAAIINKYPSKKFILTDVSIKALKPLEQNWNNVEVLEATFSNLSPETDDLIITNMTEYLMKKPELTEFLNYGSDVVLNNVQLYKNNIRVRIYSILSEIYILFKNIIFSQLGHKQLQFRGWLRTVDDFFISADSSNKYLKSVIMDKNKDRMRRYGTIHSAMIHYSNK